MTLDIRIGYKGNDGTSRFNKRATYKGRSKSMQKQIVSDAGEISYLTPEGKHQSLFLGVSEIQNKQGKQMLRVNIECKVAENRGIRFRAGRNFQPNLVEGSGLYWFLKVWLGKERLKKLIEDGANWDTLIGERGIAEIKHVYTEQPVPFVNIASMRPVYAVQDSVTVNVPKLVKVTTTATSTATVTKNVPAVVRVAETMTAPASTCPYCGTELNRFGPVR